MPEYFVNPQGRQDCHKCNEWQRCFEQKPVEKQDVQYCPAVVEFYAKYFPDMKVEPKPGRESID